MSRKLSRLLELADEIENFSLGHCGPSDDPDKQTAYIYAFRDVAKRFVAAAKRLGDPDLSDLVVGLDTSPESITDAYDLRANLFGGIDYLKDAAEKPEYEQRVFSNVEFVGAALISQLQLVKSSAFDLAKLVRFCEELNDCYRRGNYLSCALLIRATINHVPPIFGVQTFGQAVAGAGRSVKTILSKLEDEARPIADLHTHMLIRAKEPLPTKNQVEPYKASFEVLIQEVLVQLQCSNG